MNFPIPDPPDKRPAPAWMHWVTLALGYAILGELTYLAWLYSQ